MAKEDNRDLEVLLRGGCMGRSHHDGHASPAPKPSRFSVPLRLGSLLVPQRGARRGRDQVAFDLPPDALGHLPAEGDRSAPPEGGPSARNRQLSRTSGAPTLGDFDFRFNAIGFLRFLLASAVVWSHTFHLGGFGADPITYWTKSSEDAGSLAVEGFFVLSGFLIVRSFERTANPLRYLWHRALRIFPGFWTCLVVTAFAFAPIAFVRERGTLAGFLTATPSSPWTYVTHNLSLAMNQYGIAGLLAHVPWPGVFNHSLWTLQYEFYCYLVVAVLGTIALMRKSFAIFSIAARPLLPILFGRRLDPRAPGGLVGVSRGRALYVLRDWGVRVRLPLKNTG